MSTPVARKVPKIALILPESERSRNQSIRSSIVARGAVGCAASASSLWSKLSSILIWRTKSGTACSSRRSCKLIMFMPQFPRVQFQAIVKENPFQMLESSGFIDS
jgi:hypothetical protein